MPPPLQTVLDFESGEFPKADPEGWVKMQSNWQFASALGILCLSESSAALHFHP